MWSFLEQALLAQPDLAPATPVGWVGVATSVMSGGVIAWLVWKHIPSREASVEAAMKAKDDQIQALISKLDVQITRHLQVEEGQRAYHAELAERQRTEYRATLREMMDHSTKQVEALGNALREDLQALQKTIEAFGAIIHQMANRRRATDSN